MSAPTVRICFVCLGNICRSPTAEAVMRRELADAGFDGRVEVDSAGTGAWHVGQPPDSRATAEGRRRGVSLSGASRQFQRSDFDRFDIVVAMDRENEADLIELAPHDDARARVRLLRSFHAESRNSGDLDVPDPYYGGDDHFELVFGVVEDGCRGLLDHLRGGPLAT